MKDFIAIDFETANECPSSVCSIGAVLVRDGEIVNTFYSLIRPEPDYYKWFCQQVHGLGHEDTDDDPTAVPLVAHNAGFDNRCLRIRSDESPPYIGRC